jgi:hypothetical protein
MDYRARSRCRLMLGLLVTASTVAGGTTWDERSRLAGDAIDVERSGSGDAALLSRSKDSVCARRA